MNFKKMKLKYFDVYEWIDDIAHRQCLLGDFFANDVKFFSLPKL